MPVSGSQLSNIDSPQTALAEHAEDGSRPLPDSSGFDDRRETPGITPDARERYLSDIFKQDVHGAPPAPAAPENADAPPSPAPLSASPAPPAAPSASDGTRIPQPSDTRPAGDTRTAQNIVDSNPTLKNLGNQSGNLDKLKKQCGDWTDTGKTPSERADAAYRASAVVSFCMTAKASDGSERSSTVTGSDRMPGYTKSGDVRSGTPAALLQDFGKYGYGNLASRDHKLAATNDHYVNKDGTTQSNLQHSDQVALNGLKKVADAFLKVAKVFEDVLSKVAGFVADLKIPGISQLAGAASVGAEAISQAENVGQTALEGGDVKAAAKNLGVNIGETAISAFTAPGVGKALGQGAKGAAELAARSAKEGGKEAASESADTPATDADKKLRQKQGNHSPQRG